jgi:hypothetical protein
MTPDVIHYSAPHVKDTARMEFISRSQFHDGTVAATYRDRISGEVHEWRWTERPTQEAHHA